MTTTRFMHALWMALSHMDIIVDKSRPKPTGIPTICKWWTMEHGLIMGCLFWSIFIVGFFTGLALGAALGMEKGMRTLRTNLPSDSKLLSIIRETDQLREHPPLPPQLDPQQQQSKPAATGDEPFLSDGWSSQKDGVHIDVWASLESMCRIELLAQHSLVYRFKMKINTLAVGFRLIIMFIAWRCLSFIYNIGSIMYYFTAGVVLYICHYSTAIMDLHMLYVVDYTRKIDRLHKWTMFGLREGLLLLCMVRLSINKNEFICWHCILRYLVGPHVKKPMITQCPYAHQPFALAQIWKWIFALMKIESWPVHIKVFNWSARHIDWLCWADWANGIPNPAKKHCIAKSQFHMSMIHQHNKYIE